MDNFFEHLSRYEFLNNILPGYIVSKALFFIIPNAELIGSPFDTFFMYYTIGLIISRIASVIVEPVLKYLNIIKFAPYEDYMCASEKKVVIKDLSTINNLYRNLLTVSIIVTMMLMFSYWENGDERYFCWGVFVFGGMIFFLFLFSYKKQTDYVRKRVEFVIRNERGE